MIKVIGILNASPDSFTSRAKGDLVQKGIDLYSQGADIIDIGGESTRPGSLPISSTEEKKRVLPLIKALSKQIPIPLSIDTYKPEVAQLALEAGASIINDITGFQNQKMATLLAESKAQGIVMHCQGTPETMQNNPSYPRGVITEIREWFLQRIKTLLESEVSKEQLIIDPGIGFGKTLADNLEIIRQLSSFSSLNLPILIGVSRKITLQKILKKSVPGVLSTTVVLNTMSVLGGASYIRVHEVEEHRRVLACIT